jgi:hypothetical protein
MNKIETKQLLDTISAIDNRQVTVEVVEAWHSIIGGIPFDIAREALKLAQQDSSIKYLEPRNIVGWAKEAAFRLDRDKAKPKEEISGDPMSVCKDHNKPIMTCNPCCHRLYKYSQSHGFERIHAFAKAEIYV